MIQGSPYGLQCGEKCPRNSRCDEWGGSDLSYPFEGQNILSRQWDHCPAKPLQDRRLLVAVSLYRAGQFAALAGWPDLYPAWLERWVLAIDQQIKARQIEQIEKR